MAEEIRTDKLFWVDLEMTGLSPDTCHILEAAVVITDRNLKHVDEYHRVVFQPPEIVAEMDDWCKKTHGDSGLTAAIPQGTPLPQVEKELVELASKHFGKNKVVLCGNSVGHDRKFIDRFMPTFSARLHYRIVDVSSFKEIFQENYKIDFEKKETHRALDDIHESIAELAHYLSFVKPPEQKS